MPRRKEMVRLPNGGYGYTGQLFCGTEKVAEGLGEQPSDIDDFVGRHNKWLAKLKADVKLAEAKQGVPLGFHIYRAEDSFAKLLPKVKCHCVTRDGIDEITYGGKQSQYLLTIPELWTLKDAMHPPREWQYYRDKKGVRRRLECYCDSLPIQSRVGGRLGPAWTSEMIAESHRYLPKGYVSDEVGETEPIARPFDAYRD